MGGRTRIGKGDCVAAVPKCSDARWMHVRFAWAQDGLGRRHGEEDAYCVLCVGEVTPLPADPSKEERTFDERESCLLPQSEIHPVEAGHFAWEQAAEEYGRLVTDWVRGGYRRVAD